MISKFCDFHVNPRSVDIYTPTEHLCFKLRHDDQTEYMSTFESERGTTYFLPTEKTATFVSEVMGYPCSGVFPEVALGDLPILLEALKVDKDTKGILSIEADLRDSYVCKDLFGELIVIETMEKLREYLPQDPYTSMFPDIDFHSNVSLKQAIKEVIQFWQYSYKQINKSTRFLCLP